MTDRVKRLKRRLQRSRSRRQPIQSRRFFLAQSLAFFFASILSAVRGLGQTKRAHAAGASSFRPGGLIRPPTANVDDGAFRRSCIRCGLCGSVCESGCIRYFGLDEPEHGAFTPYIEVRERSCTLCMRCTNVCPTGALTPVEDDMSVIAESVDMGTAVVDADRCISYEGRLCGYCHDACPLPGTAIRLVSMAKPVVIADGCVGCGRCVELCPQNPTAIDVRRLS
jgi:ferredoxin-type protein NapG